MSAVRCPQCHAVLTEAEARTTDGTCPECATPLPGDFGPPWAVPVAPPGAPRRSRASFVGGLVAGCLLGGAGGAAAWWAWGPPARIAPGRAEPVAPATAAAPVAAVEPRPEAGPAPRETARAEAADRLSAALVQLAVAAEAASAQARNQSAIVQDEEAGKRARDQRADAERALTEVNARLQAAREQAAALDRQLQDRTLRLADGNRVLTARQAELTGLDRSVAAKRAELTGLDRSLTAKRAELAGLERAARAKAAPAQAPAAAGRGGFVRDWLVVGPFKAPRGDGHTAYFPTQAGPVDPDKEYKGILGPVRWRAHASPADYVDLAGVFQTEDPAVGYAVCWVRPARAGRARVRTGSNDGIIVWVNGKVVLDRKVSRGAEPDQDRADCDLTAGWNEVRVKVDNTGGRWGFYLDLREASADKPLGPLEFRTTPPKK